MFFEEQTIWPKQLEGVFSCPEMINSFFFFSCFVRFLELNRKTRRAEHCIAMVRSKVLKQLSILEQHKLDDEDIVEDVQFLNEKLQASVQDLRYLVTLFSLPL